MPPEHVFADRDWINNYPRRSFGFKSSAELWAVELAQLQASIAWLKLAQMASTAPGVS